MSELPEQLEVAEMKLASLRSQLAKIEHQVAVEEERVSLLRRLSELEKFTPGQPPDGSNPSVAATQTAPQAKPTSRSRLEDAVVSILSGHTEALHIGEIRSKLLELGIRIPCKG